ncbi:MAG: GTP cyclohydrolase I FolE [Holosporales bacterium]|jgi:GTP cyclohydrolase I
MNTMPIRPSRAEAESAVETLLRWSGDNPQREGLLGTPDRVVRAFEEYFEGYNEDPTEILKAASYDRAGYDDMVVLRDIRFESHCEHHIAPILGTVYIAYLPDTRVVGISKLARVCDVFAKRLQIQEKLTAEIANAIDTALKPRGVAIVISAGHECMTTRGVYKPGMNMVTRAFTGQFREDATLRREFLDLLNI